MLSPLPVAIVTCGGDRRGEDGALSPSGFRPNAVTVAWCGIACTQPPVVYISLRPSRHSHKIITETGEFTINLVTSAMVRRADSCGVYSGRDVDKVQKFSLPLAPSASGTVGCPSLDDSPVTLDCRVMSVTPLGTHDMFLASVCGVGVDPALVDDGGRLCLERAHLAAYSHGSYYELGRKLGDFGFSVRKKRSGKGVGKSKKGTKKALGAGDGR